MLKFCSLSSGSCGNAAFLRWNDTRLLVDAGLGIRYIASALADQGESLSQLDALLLTHEHHDHVLGVPALTRHNSLRVYASEGTFRQLWNRPCAGETVPFVPGADFDVGDIHVETFSLSHDAAEPAGYSCLCGNTRITVVTDTGCLTDAVLEKISGSHTILLEANHDIDMLQAGHYPVFLKQRILGDLGHLSNRAAGDAAAYLAAHGTRRIILGHLSERYNLRELALETVTTALKPLGIMPGRDVELDLAGRLIPGTCYTEWPA